MLFTTLVSVSMCDVTKCDGKQKRFLQNSAREKIRKKKENSICINLKTIRNRHRCTLIDSQNPIKIFNKIKAYSYRTILNVIDAN